MVVVDDDNDDKGLLERGAGVVEVEADSEGVKSLVKLSLRCFSGSSPKKSFQSKLSLETKASC